MARRKLTPFTPLLVALVAVVLGFLAVGPSFAGDLAPSDGPVPASTTSAPSPPASVTPSAVPSQAPPPDESVPIHAPTTKPKTPKTVAPGPVSCASCMAPPGA